MRRTVGDIPQEYTLSRTVGRHDCDEVDGDGRSKLDEEEQKTFCRTLADRPIPHLLRTPVFINLIHTLLNHTLTSCLRINGRPGSECSSCCRSVRVALVDFPAVVAAAVASDWPALSSCSASAVGLFQIRCSTVCSILTLFCGNGALTSSSSGWWSPRYQVLASKWCAEGNLQRRYEVSPMMQKGWSDSSGLSQELISVSLGLRPPSSTMFAPSHATFLP